MNPFNKVKNYPTNATFIIILFIALGAIMSFYFRSPFLIFPFAFVGAFIYYQMAIRYICPHCKAFLWFVKDKKNLKECPKCGAVLREDEQED